MLLMKIKMDNLIILFSNRFSEKSHLSFIIDSFWLFFLVPFINQSILSYSVLIAGIGNFIR